MKIIFAVLLVTLAWVNADFEEPFRYYGHDYARTSIGDSIDKATLKVLKEAYEGGKDKNVVSSPLGVLLLLSLYSNGAGVGSQQEIANILGGGDYKELSASYSHLSNHFAQMDPSYLTLANKIYVAEQFNVDDEFAAVAGSYNSEVDKINFGDSQKAADTINAWSEKKTQGHIKSPVSPDDLGPDTAAALFNVIFFQGHWHVPFNASETKDEDFHVDKDTVVKKPTMKLLQSLFYAESKDLGAKLIELPYKENGFRMVVVLPDEIDGLPSVLEKAAQKGLLEDVFKLAPAGAEVALSMPKFEIKTKHDLNAILPKVGISKIFEEPANGIVKGTPVKVSKAFQEAFVKVDEEGATAGAFTDFTIDTRASFVNSKILFAVDHPFLFLILYQDKTMFAGTYSS